MSNRRMSNFTVVVMPGDGIGKTVTPEALRVLKPSASRPTTCRPTSAGISGSARETPCRSGTTELLKKHKLGLFGRSVEAEEGGRSGTLAGLQGKGCVITARSSRCGSFSIWTSAFALPLVPGNPLNFVRRNGEGMRNEIDAVIFRQNTRALLGRRVDQPAQGGPRRARTHPQMKNYRGVEGPDLAVSCRILTRGPAAGSSARFEHATKFGYKSVTICESRTSSANLGMMEEEAKRIAANIRASSCGRPISTPK